MLFLVGLGLRIMDLPYRAIPILKSCSHRYLELYTSISDLEMEKERLESIVGKVEILEREELENGIDKFLKIAKTKDIAIMTIGDPLVATTHFILIHEARKRGIKFEVIHSASILNAIANTGLFIYKFGRIVSIPFRDKVKCPESVYDYIKMNKSIGLHTLALLDLEVKKKRYMDPYEALAILLEIEEKRKEKVFSLKDKVISCSRLGLNEEKIVYITIKDLIEKKPFLGRPPFSLVIPGNLSEIEKEFLETFMI